MEIVLNNALPLPSSMEKVSLNKATLGNLAILRANSDKPVNDLAEMIDADPDVDPPPIEVLSQVQLRNLKVNLGQEVEQ